MLGGGAAASSHNADAQILHEVGKVPDEFLRLQRIVRMPPDILGHPGVRHDKDRFGAGACKGPDVVGHFFRAGGAVYADDIDIERFERHESRGDLRPKEHGPHGLNRDGRNDGNPAAQVLETAEDAVEGRLCLEKILAGFHAEEVGSPLKKSPCLLLIGSRHLLEPYMSE